jgi:hypothetical protein
MWQIKRHVERMLEPWPDNAVAGSAMVVLIGIAVLWVVSSRTK